MRENLEVVEQGWLIGYVWRGIPSQYIISGHDADLLGLSWLRDRLNFQPCGDPSRHLTAGSS